MWEWLQIKHSNNYEIVLSPEVYEESEFIEYPNTTFEHNKKLRGLHWNAIFSPVKMPNIRPVKQIEFKNKDLVDLVKRKVIDMTSVHIRRGDLVDDGSEAYKQWLDRDADNWKYAYLDDEYYIKICDRIVETNPREIFYLSTDATLDEVKFFTDRYDVVMSDNLLLNIKERNKWGFAYTNPPKTPPLNIHDITDILALSYSKRFVASNSMWSEFCSVYRKVPTIYPPNCFNYAPRAGLYYIK
jgi:hypothetical protein